jgi:iron(III) transport system ATP-binding protein
MTQVRLHEISKVYGSGSSATPAVRNVSLVIESGELFFLLGPSGCGKTTLLRIIAGLLEPTSGRLFFGERDVTDLGVDRREAAMVFQSYALWPHMTVAQNVAFGPKMRGLGAQARKVRVSENLARVQMDAYASRKPNQLSGGQQQRVALARALAAGSQCLLLDEPLSNLDARLRLHMRVELRRLVKQTGATAIYVTHDQAEALSMADRVAVMAEGQVVQVGTPQEVYDRPRTRFVADFLGEANFLPGTLSEMGQTCRVQTDLGTLVTAPPPTPNMPVGTPVTCCVRPEHVTIAAAGPRAPGLPATVTDITYLGSVRQFHCRLGGGQTWRASCLSGEAPAVGAGAAVTLSMTPQNVIVLAE